jgi:DNA helicase-2/ATP-dependent DNA helicase PcrA
MRVSILGLMPDLPALRRIVDARLPRFVAELEMRAEAQHPPTVEGVTLASLHSAKGLEWDAVFLVGLVDGILPIQHADGDDAAVEEERRLLYVGVTRAREHLSISWALARNPGGRGRRGPSRFLESVRPQGTASADKVAAGERTGRRGKSQSGRGVAACRTCKRPLHDASERKVGRCATCPATYDEELYDQLRSWRTSQAQAQRLPAYCIFTDATLVAIAEERPGDRGGLAKIPGVGATKLEKYADDVLAICSGETPASVDDSADTLPLEAEL